MTSPPSLDDLTFERDGLVIFRSVFDATGMVDELWGVLGRRFGIDREHPTTWREGTFGKLTKWGKTGRFSAVATSAIADAVTALLGTDAHRIERWGQPLITFPTPGPWTVPSGAAWHIDHPATPSLSTIRLFAYCGVVPRRAGGTVVVAGSHRLATARPGLRSAALKNSLAERSDWFRELLGRSHTPAENGRFLDEGGVVDGVGVRVVELTGDPGDVVLWHPSLLHGIAQNCGAQPRFMLTTTAFRTQPPA